MRWNDIAFVPDERLAGRIMEAWQWKLAGRWRPFLCSMMGAVFLEDEGGGVYSLDCATGEIERLADSREAFDAAMRTDGNRVDELFLVPLVERLHDAGKYPEAGQCYAFMILPVFAEGSYAIENIWVAPAAEALVGTAELHRQLSRIADGAKVAIKIVD